VSATAVSARNRRLFATTAPIAGTAMTQPPSMNVSLGVMCLKSAMTSEITMTRNVTPAITPAAHTRPSAASVYSAMTKPMSIGPSIEELG
jgi:hypothetical protein